MAAPPTHKTPTAHIPGKHGWATGVVSGGWRRRSPTLPTIPIIPIPDPRWKKTSPLTLPLPSASHRCRHFCICSRKDRDLDYVAYELNPVAYVPVVAGTVSQGMSIGIAAQGPLFPPPLGAVPPLLYAFIGQMANVAIYNTALTQDALRAHAIAAFFVDSPG